MRWTDRQVELLIKLWNDGRSPSTIAGRLAAVGRDSVLEKIHLLQLGSPSRLASGLRHASVLRASRISRRQHSQRFKAVLAEQALRRATGEDHATAGDRAANGVGNAGPAETPDQAVLLLAGLLALAEDATAYAPAASAGGPEPRRA